MQIAVASQNRRQVTGHLGLCRRFWIYDIEAERVRAKRLLELPKEQSLHASRGAAHPLDDVQVLIGGGMGEGMVRRLTGKGIEGIVTSETDPDAAVAAYLAGTLARVKAEAHGHEHHHHHHAHHTGEVVVHFVRKRS